MATTKSIDERIREKAREALKQDIGLKFKAAYQLCNAGGAIPTKLERPSEGNYSAWACIEAAEKAVFEHMAFKAEEKAVAEFLTKIDSLQDQVDSLASDFR